jgi:beta-N-acetylhexosaminidase
MQQLSMQRLIDAVNDSELSIEQIDESVRRILSLKAAYGLLDWTPTLADTITERIDLEAAQEALLETYLDAATIVRDTNSLLPLSPDDNLAIVFPGLFHQINDVCREYAPDAVYHGYIYQPADWEYGFVSSLGQQHDKIVIFIEDAILNPAHADLVKLLPPEKTIVVEMGLPFDLELVGDVSTFTALWLHEKRLAMSSLARILPPGACLLPLAIIRQAAGLMWERKNDINKLSIKVYKVK